MKALLFVTLFVVARAELPTTRYEDTLEKLLVAINKLPGPGRAASALREVVPLFDTLILEEKQLKSLSDQDFINYCLVKVSSEHDGRTDANFLNGCALDCMGELAGLWKDGEPAGYYKTFKQFGDIVMEKYSDLDEAVVNFARFGQKCMIPAAPCMGMSQISQCS